MSAGSQPEYGSAFSASRARASDDELADWLAFALAACDDADVVALGHFRREIEIHTKPDRSFVTEADQAIERLIRERIRPALRDPILHKRWEDIMLDLTGGPRAFDREGFRVEENTDWRRVELAVAAGLALNR